MRIYVKFMVSGRCCDKIGEELMKWGMMPDISQGVMEFQEELDGAELLHVKESLLELGYEAVDTYFSELLDRITGIIKRLICMNPEIPVEVYPEYLQEQGLMEPEIIQVFSQVYGVDLIQYAKVQQVERIKEILLYEDLKLGEIVTMFGFTGKDQLKGVFKRITGLTPGFYKKIRKKRSKIRNEYGFGETISAIKETN